MLTLLMSSLSSTAMLLLSLFSPLSYVLDPVFASGRVLHRSKITPASRRCRVAQSYQSAFRRGIGELLEPQFRFGGAS